MATSSTAAKKDKKLFALRMTELFLVLIVNYFLIFIYIIHFSNLQFPYIIIALIIMI